jgi:hypothetical protein
MRAAGATGVATVATATTQFDRDPPAVSGALASARVRFEVDGASGSLVCGPNARLIPNETNSGTNSAQRFRGTNGWAEVTLNHGWTAETGGRQRSGSTWWEADDVDAQVGYYSDFFGAIRSDTVGSFPTAIESVAGETRMLLDASQAA